jgi:hypothetical protein
MHGINPRGRRIIGVVSLSVSFIFGTLTFASLPAGAQTAPSTSVSCPVLSVGNPNAGDDLQPGDDFISGSAFDPRASPGSTSSWACATTVARSWGLRRPALR